jgi:hypothetical protein
MSQFTKQRAREARDWEAKHNKRRRRRKPSRLAGLGSVLPRARSGSVRARTATPARGTTSAGLPSLGRRHR